MVRLYFNRHGAKPWSLDRGDGTPESQVTKVYAHWVALESCCVPLAAGDDPEVKPCAWIEFYKADFKVLRDGTAVIERVD